MRHREISDMVGLVGRLWNLQYKNIVKEASGKTLAVAKFFCVLHVTNTYLCTFTLVKRFSLNFTKHVLERNDNNWVVAGPWSQDGPDLQSNRRYVPGGAALHQIWQSGCQSSDDKKLNGSISRWVTRSGRETEYWSRAFVDQAERQSIGAEHLWINLLFH